MSDGYMMDATHGHGHAHDAASAQELGATHDHPHGGRGVVRIFKRLRAGRVVAVEHGLHTLPIVDVYRLDYFPVVSAADEQTLETWVNFYLYHTSDRSVHRPSGAAG